MTQQNSALVEENAATAKTLEHQARAMDERVAFFLIDGNAAVAQPKAQAKVRTKTAAAAGAGSGAEAPGGGDAQAGSGERQWRWAGRPYAVRARHRGQG